MRLVIRIEIVNPPIKDCIAPTQVVGALYPPSMPLPLLISVSVHMINTHLIHSMIILMDLRKFERTSNRYKSEKISRQVTQLQLQVV